LRKILSYIIGKEVWAAVVTSEYDILKEYETELIWNIQNTFKKNIFPPNILF